MTAYLLLGATYGFAAGAQPGQLQAYLINRAVAHGWRSTLPAAFAPVISDAPIIALVLTVLTRVPPLLLDLLQLAGGVFLLYLAWTAARSHSPDDVPSSSGAHALGKAALLNLLNPNPYIAWSLVMGPLSLEAWRVAPSHAIALVGVFYGMMVAVSAGIVLVFAMTRSLGARVSRACILGSSVVLALFGVYQLWSALAAVAR